MIERIQDGRTDLVFEYLAGGHDARTSDSGGVELIKWCAYFGDVSAIRFLLAHGESLETLGNNFDLNGACFHGHWQLCQFLIERGADVNFPLDDTGETPLHAALSKPGGARYDAVVQILLARGADASVATKPGIETGSFMRDCRTKGETPLHRAAAFTGEQTIQMLLDAGAKIEAKDMNGETPLSWASWYLRPASVLRKLCYGGFRIHPASQSMELNLTGKPHVQITGGKL
jgi:ankyrin repeat protein